MSRYRSFVFTFLFLATTSCTPETAPPAVREETLSGRDRAAPIYHAFVPLHWRRIDPEPHVNLRDTMQPICTFVFDEIRLTVHNFPYEALEQRVAMRAQIERWQRQLGPGDVEVYAHGGFGGFRLEGEGMIGYAMQLTPVLFRELSDPEKRADYTLKAVGPPSSIERERENIHAFANSFELIHPIPSPL